MNPYVVFDAKMFGINRFLNTSVIDLSKIIELCRATKCSIHNMLSRGAYCVPCIHNMLPLKSGAYCVGHVSYLHNMLPS